jgi:hypothetical protein
MHGTNRPPWQAAGHPRRQPPHPLDTRAGPGASATPEGREARAQRRQGVFEPLRDRPSTRVVVLLPDAGKEAGTGAADEEEVAAAAAAAAAADCHGQGAPLALQLRATLAMLWPRSRAPPARCGAPLTVPPALLPVRWPRALAPRARERARSAFPSLPVL